jgi:geranylgeranyl diphosphate synthase type II
MEFYTNLFKKRLQEIIATKEPANLYDPVNYIMTLGGKRIRPSLALMSCHLFGSDPSKALDAAMAVEMFHNFTLIHDDIMDRADIRRGKATVHKKWDLNTGILSGDVLLILSYEQLESYPAEIYKELMQIFNKTAIEVCEGQQMDMDFELRTDVRDHEYFKMIRYKTAVLLGCALQMGAKIAGAGVDDQKAIYDFGVNLGTAFQLQDDYLDSFGGADFGKRIGGDILEAKKTFLYLKTLEQAEPEDRKTFLKIYEEPLQLPAEGSSVEGKLADERIELVKTLFKKYGADELLQKEIKDYTSKALQNVEELSLDEKGKGLLREFSNLLMNRKT